MEQKQYFEAVPISELPEIDTMDSTFSVEVPLMKEKECLGAGHYYYRTSEWLVNGGYECIPTHWLRPVSLSDLIKEEARRAWDECEKWKGWITDLELEQKKTEYLKSLKF